MIGETAFRTRFEAGELRALERLCRDRLGRDPLDPEASYWLARVAAETGHTDQALSLLAAATGRMADPRYASGVADSLRRRGQGATALDLVQRASEQFPHEPMLHTQLGSLLADTGDFDAADSAYRRAIDLDPLSGEAYYLRTLILPVDDSDPYVAGLEAALRRPALIPKRRQDLCFALGRIYDRSQRYEEAFRYFEEGNRIARSLRTYDAARDRTLAERLIRHFDAGLLRSARGAGLRSRVPVLIVGMPRSGSSLVEQIIAAHPGAAGVGEAMDLREVIDHGIGAFLPAGASVPEDLARMRPAGWGGLAKRYLERISARAPGMDRITDKQLFNVRLVGMFQLMFPEAVTIQCRRDPMDTCLSCYQSLFDAGTDFIYDQRELGGFWRIQDQLMQHWAGSFPDRVMQVDYEELVADPETVSRRIIAHIGLPWDDACASPHRAQRAVSTTSMGQVRQPIYASSVGRWRNYEQWLGPLREALAGSQ